MAIFFLTYGSHDMRHTSFPQVDGGQWDLQDMGRHTNRIGIIYASRQNEKARYVSH